MRLPVPAVLGLSLLLVGAAAAQSSSGRHRVQPAEPAEAAADAGRAATGWSWYIDAGAGLATSGDVLRIRTDETSGIDWAPPGGQTFNSRDVRLTLDENLGLACGLGRRLSSLLWARLDVGVTTIDLAAEARVGEGAEVYLWDRLGFVAASAGLEYRFVDLPSFPYLLAGVGIDVVDGRDSQFDQTRLAWRAGAGYQQALVEPWSLRLEVRDSVANLDLADYVPPVAGSLTPNFRLEEKNPVHLFELLVLLTGSF
ncbi:MAG: hypothetical protein R3D98_12190 [Candidatus Krumholzibacteriia bacterium]